MRVVSLSLLLLLPALPVCSAQEVTPQMQALYEKAHGEQESHPEAAVADYRALIKLAPELAPAYNNLGRLLFNLHRFGEAVPVLEKGLQLNPEMHPAQAMLGACLYQTGDAAGAVAPLQAAMAAMPSDRFVQLTLVRALLATQQEEQAVPVLQALTASDPKDQESWYLLGKVQLAQSRESFARVQAIDPNSVTAHTLAGEIMESMSNLPGAILEYKKAVVVSPDDPGAEQHLASAYFDAGDWQPALDAYRGLLKQSPKNCQAHWKVSKALNEMAAPAAEAATEAHEATELCPKLSPAYLEEARARLRENQPAAAVALLKKSEAITPDEPSIQALLAHAYRAQGQTAEASAAQARFAALTKAEHESSEQHAAEVLGRQP